MKRVDSLVAQRAYKGWMLSGKYDAHSKSKGGSQFLCVGNVSEKLIRSLWELDVFGISSVRESKDGIENSGKIIEVNGDSSLPGPVYYLPHRPVVREDSKTTKVRPVLDASAKSHDGVSSNDCLEAEPNLFPNLLDVLNRGRSWKMAVLAESKKSFFIDKASERKPK
ncbi:hypothetical protein RRG08_057211 [Elysia crispata]|uniref:Uncharacterized protein n=1 Tax=Elysia crispata TaxID=231223 RepID=A0AAE0XWM4_9GAST|nr:hypothetical protein RRG08_057211 [Elysia crispata]